MKSWIPQYPTCQHFEQLNCEALCLTLNTARKKKKIAVCLEEAFVRPDCFNQAPTRNNILWSLFYRFSQFLFPVAWQNSFSKTFLQNTTVWGNFQTTQNINLPQAPPKRTPIRQSLLQFLAHYHLYFLLFLPYMCISSRHPRPRSQHKGDLFVSEGTGIKRQRQPR